MPLFKKKQEELNPLDQVMSMRQQGLTDDQIIQNLQSANYAPDQIFNILNQANPQQSPEMAYSEPEPQPMPQPDQTPPPAPVDTGVDRQHIEEVAEAIIDEKWDELVKNINKIIEWKNRSEARLERMEQQIKDLKEEYDKLHQAVIGKIGEYDQNIINVGTEIKVMEKVFQKILPTFTENVNELNRLTKKMKTIKK